MGFTRTIDDFVSIEEHSGVLSMEPITTLLASFAVRHVLTGEFMAGIVGNLVASAGYDSGKLGLHALSAKLDKVWGQPGVSRNHDLLRALLFAESRAAMQVCELCLVECRSTRLTILDICLSDQEVSIIDALRQEYRAWSDQVQTMSIGRLDLMVTSALSDVGATIAAGRESSVAEGVAALRGKAAEQASAMLEIVQEEIWATAEPEQLYRLFRAAPRDRQVPSTLRQMFERDWFDLFRAGFREALKSDAFKEARRAFELDVLSQLDGVPPRLRSIEGKLSVVDQKLDRMLQALAGSTHPRMEAEQIAGNDLANVTADWRAEQQKLSDTIASRVVDRLRAESELGRTSTPSTSVRWSGRAAELADSALLVLGFAATAAAMTFSGKAFEVAAPAFFGSLLGFVVSGRLWPALFCAALSSPVYEAALSIGAKYEDVLLGGTVGALAMSVLQLPWARRRRWIVPTGLVAGAIGSIAFAVLLSTPFSYLLWQVIVGCAVYQASQTTVALPKFSSMTRRGVLVICASASLFAMIGWATTSARLFLNEQHVLFADEPAHGRRVLVSRPHLLLADWNSSNGAIRIWSLQTQTVRRRFQLPKSIGVQNGAFSDDGKYFAAGDWARTARVWDIEGGRLLWTFGDATEEGTGTSVAFTRDGKTLFTDAGGTLRAYSVQTGAAIAEFQTDRVVVTSFDVSPDGTLLAATLVGGGHLIIDIPTLSVLSTGLKDSSSVVAFAPDGRRIAFAHNLDDVYRVSVWTIRGGEFLEEHVLDSKARIDGIRWSPTGAVLAVSNSGAENATTLWNVRTGNKQSELECTTRSSGALFTFSPDGALFACYGGSITIWRAETGQLVQTIRGSNDDAAFFTLGFDSGLAVGTSDGASLWFESDRYLGDAADTAKAP